MAQLDAPAVSRPRQPEARLVSNCFVTFTRALAADAMTAAPLVSDEDLRARACAELRRGGPILLVAGETAALAVAVERVDAPALVALDAWAAAAQTGEPVLAITDRRAETLRARLYDGDLARIELDRPLDLRRLRAIADPALDLDAPLLGPYRSRRDGDAALARAALALAKRARLLPAMLLWTAAAERLAAAASAARLVTLAAPRDDAEPFGAWTEAVSARVPIAADVGARLRVFRRAGWDDEHYAIEIGAPARTEPVLVRLHSACATGDLFGSLKCDCGPQLTAALHRIGEAGGGVLVYLQQEGRGIGLANKMRAYKLQDQGFDTVEANHRLGFGDDERLLTDGGEILRAMGVTRARLMTNNPRKVAALTDAGVEVVQRVPLVVGETVENARYLAVKAAKSGHLL